MFSLRRVIREIDVFVFPRFVVPLISLLPPAIAYGVAILRANLLFSLGVGRSRETEECMKFVLGNQLTQEQYRKQAQNYMRNRSCRLVDAIRLVGDGRYLLRLVEIHGLDNLALAFNRGKGVILCSAHFGSPYCSFSVVGALGFPVTLVARWSYPTRESGTQTQVTKRLDKGLPFNSHLTDRNIKRRKDNLGVAVQAASVLRRGGVLGIMLDSRVRQDDPTRPVTVDFLNGRAKFPTGPITLSKITGAPVLVMLLYRSPNMKRLILEISPPIVIDSDQTGSLRRCLTPLEKRIRDSPGQWDHWTIGGMIDFGLMESEKGRRKVSTKLV